MAIECVNASPQMNKKKNQTWQEYYKINLARTNIHDEIIRKRNTRADIIEAIIENTKTNGRILEAGCGTSILSIILNKMGYKNYCIDNEYEMLEMAKKINKEAKTKVNYHFGSLYKIPFEDYAFDTIFSHGVLEHFNEKNIINAINEGLRVAKTYVISFPTIFSRGHPALYGDENLWSYFHWKKIIESSRGYIDRAYSMYPKNTVMGSLNKMFNKRLYIISSEIGFVVKAR